MSRYIAAGIVAVTVGGIISLISGYTVWNWKWRGIFLPLMVLAYIFGDTEEDE